MRANTVAQRASTSIMRRATVCNSSLRVHTYCVAYVRFLYSRLATVLTERGYCVDLPQRRCSFPASNHAANASTAAGLSAPSCQLYSAPPASSFAASLQCRGNQYSANNSVLREPRAATTARVAFGDVTITSHDRYSPRMALPCARQRSMRRRFANTGCLQ
jgi:hypothetical protein